MNQDRAALVENKVFHLIGFRPELFSSTFDFNPPRAGGYLSFRGEEDSARAIRDSSWFTALHPSISSNEYTIATESPRIRFTKPLHRSFAKREREREWKEFFTTYRGTTGRKIYEKRNKETRICDSKWLLLPFNAFERSDSRYIGYIDFWHETIVKIVENATRFETTYAYINDNSSKNFFFVFTHFVK